MTRGRDENHLAIYPAVTTEADQHSGDSEGIHHLQHGTKHAAAKCFRMILANDDRAATMHAVAARTDPELLPTTVVALLQRNEQRRAHRAQAWRRHSAQDRARAATMERITTTMRQESARRSRSRSRSRDQGYGLEL